MNLSIEPYLTQILRWPKTGRCILAQYDADSIVVYQAYRPSIGLHAVQQQKFGGEFSFTRMSWIKTNFLWMMYRSGWGTKPGQEVILAIRIQRSGFDWLLRAAVHASFVTAIYQNHTVWANAVAHSPVLVQWDPDHAPNGTKSERRAIQLGLRNEALIRYAQDWLIEIEDISEFVVEQRANVQRGTNYGQLLTPNEQIYPIYDTGTMQTLGIGLSK